MKKVLVLGATGAMGRYLVPELAKLNYEVLGVGLEDAAPWKVNASYLKGDAFQRSDHTVIYVQILYFQQCF